MESLPVGAADVAIVLVIVASGVFALFRGFVHELLAVASWIGAAIATIYGFPHLQPEARKLISIPLAADMAAGIVIFLVVLIALSVVTRIIASRVRHSSLGPLDRSLGLVFGFLRGAVLVCLAWLLLLWAMPREDHPTWVSHARVLPLVEIGGELLIAMIPDRLRGETARTLNGAGSAVERLGGDATGYRTLLSPPAKAQDTPDASGYNARMREEMKRAIEAATQETGVRKESVQ